jgi:RNA polymerase sigma-70 factor (ECF subfamily)
LFSLEKEAPGVHPEQASLTVDTRAFEAIVNEYGDVLLRTARLIVIDQAIAEDVVQDSLILAWKHLPTLRNSDALRAWLIKIVANQSISFKRRATRMLTLFRQAAQEQEMSAANQTAEAASGIIEGRWDLRQAVARLPMNQRVVVVLHYYHDLSVPQIASTLNLSQNTVKKRLQAGLTRLRQLLVQDAPVSGRNIRQQASDLPTPFEPKGQRG